MGLETSLCVETYILVEHCVITCIDLEKIGCDNEAAEHRSVAETLFEVEVAEEFVDVHDVLVVEDDVQIRLEIDTVRFAGNGVVVEEADRKFRLEVDEVVRFSRCRLGRVRC